MRTFIFEPGIYCISDPCYFIKNRIDWKQFLDAQQKYPNILLNGLSIHAFKTAGGDGTFYDNQGQIYYVDSGLMAIFPQKNWPEPELKKDQMRYWGVYTFHEPFKVQWDKGFFVFGNITIDTRHGNKIA